MRDTQATTDPQSTGGPGGAHEKAALMRILWAEGETVVPLVEPVIELGRLSSNHVRIASEAVADVHARLVREGTAYRFHQLSSERPTLLRGAAVNDYLLQPGDRLEIAPGTAGAVTLVFEAPESIIIGDLLSTPGASPDEATVEGKTWRLDLLANGTLTIGRSTDNDLVLPSLSVALLHARLDLRDGVAVITETEKTSGIFVNGGRVRRRTLVVGDIVRIGPFKIMYRGDTLEYQDDSKAVRLDAYRVTRFIGRKQILDGISFCALPGEVMAIAGTSGAGKSTLLYALTGIGPPNAGRVMVNGADLYQSFEALQPLLGYVPQRDILPGQLPVRRALHYVARLRLPPDVASEEMDQRIDDVMRSLDLYQRRDVALGSLSGGQQKRASIAAELIAKPGLFYLDEPTSGLDPGLARRVAEIMQDMARRNSTVVVISHDVEGLQAADKLVFLATGGRLAFIGSPHEALEYFNVDDLADVYPRLESEDSAVWQERFKESRQYQTHVAPALTPVVEEGSRDGASVSWDPTAVFAVRRGRGASAWRQFLVTVMRYAETMVRDRRNLLVLLAQAPIIALFLTLVAKATDFNPPPAAAVTQAAAFGIPAAKLAPGLAIMLAATATWFGAINSAREIVKEMPIFLRDRLSGMRILPYLSSKVLVLAVLCMIQTLALLAIVALKVDLPPSGALMWGPLELWITLCLASFAAMGIGLLISASMGNPDRAQSLVPIVLIPQLIFIGGPSSGKAGEWLSYLTVTRWSSQAMKITAGIPYRANPGGFSESDLLLHWAALAAMVAVFIALAGVQLLRRRGS
jgi:ABC-type multidrug transport system ATPase subunit/pSer/pThr/pTyr-binding forkhead associated (FHA) protein